MAQTSGARANAIVVVSDKHNASRIKGQQMVANTDKQYALGELFGEFLFECSTSAFYRGLHDDMDRRDEKFKQTIERTPKKGAYHRRRIE